ncbi:hypothetical protein ACFLQV_02760 [Calditrichota bacterium]
MNLQRILISILVIIAFAVSSWAADGTITDFAASSQGKSVLVEWHSATEMGIKEYQVQRSYDGNRFYTVATIAPKGDNSSYQHIDDDLYKQTMDTYYYRVEAVRNGGQKEISRVEAVTISFSDIHRTWGSIKALFR